MKCYLCPRGAVLGVVREREREVRTKFTWSEVLCFN
jgi:hypothetical protein